MSTNRLGSSKYAPKTPAETLAQSKAEKLKQEKERATRLFVRLQWKAESLRAAYTRAVDIVRAEKEPNGSAEQPITSPFGSISKQAEAMFKVDFFEFYTLLERYITISLAIVGVYVSANAPRVNVNALRFQTNPEWAKTRPEASHAFHANLLEAIDKESGPLHVSFGNSEVRPQLGLAKDYRNAWKDADEKVNGKEKENERRDTQLQDLELEDMLRLLLAGCEHAHGIVQSHSEAPTNSVTSRDFEPQTYTYETMETDAPFEYMDDAMDLD
ncbi:hypothetical protein P280DRAFT_28663 [Massarina eburnea CBS 473.64]|uniref:Uncharacterized protein n=1 Tax=Massarina eburnea CBS 473.64 TaxID=1395130 RepID=A0A6A6RZE6_9PLEO|nr:hypothetical protein P280DRAFT_28663 [Massarina eburnea CBS 473.64]